MNKIKIWLSKITLTDKFIIVMLFLLLFQSTYTIFTHDNTVAPESSKLDFILRTALSSIFGYMLSLHSNNDNDSQSNIQPPDTQPYINNVEIVQPQPDIEKEMPQIINIDTTTKSTNNVEIEASTPYYSQPTISNKDNNKIIIVGVIGLFSLTVLIIVRNLNIENFVSTAAITQMRDIASGSIGFLIGFPNTEKSV